MGGALTRPGRCRPTGARWPSRSPSWAAWRCLTLLAVGAATSGCASLDYVAHSALGHWRLLRSARPVDTVIADPATPAALRTRLALSQRLRDYAVTDLGLPDNASYRRYADLHRSAAVWNVVAAPPLGLTLRTWCYPVVGCVGYRGYDSLAAADAAAAELRRTGDDVTVYPVPAYSTLGKLPGAAFADPLLNTFIDEPTADLAGLIFHELAHQVAYAPGDTEFNESYATSVERLGVQRWLQASHDTAEQARHAAALSRRAQFNRLVFACRDRLAALYASAASDDDKRAGKAAAIAELQSEAARQLGSGRNPWIDAANNASLGLLGAYADLVPRFERLYQEEGGDFRRYHARVRQIAALPAAERRAALPPAP